MGQRTLPQAVILAGGRGTRLAPITDTIPKPMIRFHGKPFLAYLLTLLREQGFERALLLLGYLPDRIQEYFGDGEEWGLHIEYSVSDVDNDTGLRLKLARDLIDEVFLLMYCDNYWPMQIGKMWEKFVSVDTKALVTVYNNRDNYTRSNLRVDKSDRVVVYDKTRTAPNLQGVDIGFLIARKGVIDLIPSGNVSFEGSVYPMLIADGQLAAYKTDHRYYSVGDHRRLALTDTFLADKKAVILDRDGVLNKKAPKADYVKTWTEFEWLPGAKEALALLSRAGYTVMVVTNQAGIARGMMDEADLDDIHEQMKHEAQAVGGKIDAIYQCPHGWKEGCLCRKPKPGMLFQAQRDFHLDLTRTFFIGDDDRDVMAGQAAGCKTVLVSESFPLVHAVKEMVLAAPQVRITPIA